MSQRIAVTVLLLLHNAERWVAAMVRTAADACTERGGRAEILAVDQRSVDNTLSALGVLYGQLGDLRVLQDIPPGLGLARGLSQSRGKLLLVCDRPVDGSELSWAMRALQDGAKAAVIAGRVLGLPKSDAILWLGGKRGGLVAAEERVLAMLRDGDAKVAYRAPENGVGDRLERFVRGRLGRVGLAAFDRPLRRKSSTGGGGLL